MGNILRADDNFYRTVFNYRKEGLVMNKWLLAGLSGVLIAGLEAAPAPFEIQQPNYKTYTFEDGKVPKEFTAGPGSRLSVGSEMYKGGRRALRWDWDRPGAYIQYKNPEAFRNLTGENPDPIVYDWVTFCAISTFKMWVFSDTKFGTQLNCTFLPKSNFYVNMNFEGWGSVELIYGRDLAVFPGNTDTLVIRAPKGVAKGTLWIDDFAPRIEEDVRFVPGTSRMPYVYNKKLNSEQVRYFADDQFKTLTAAPPQKMIKIAKPTRLTAEQSKILDRLADEFFKPFRATPRKYKLNDNQYKGLLGYRQRFKVSRVGRFVNGQINGPMQFYGAMFNIGYAYRFADMTKEQRKELQNLIFDMADLIIQQGHYHRYALRNSFIAPLLLLRKDLEATGRYDKLINRLKPLVEIPSFYVEKPLGDADFYNTALIAAYGTILLQNDKTQQWQDLEALRHWLDATSSPGGGEFWRDGTFSHHCMVYTGYGFPAITPLCSLVYHLRGTPFFSEQMYQLARRSMMGKSFYCTPFAPHMFSGRWRNCAQFGWGMAACLDLLARCKPQIDRELAARYLHYADYYKKDTPEARAYRKAGIQPDPMNGALAKNYAMSLSHRRGNLTATVRGQRNGVFANEIYAFQAGNTMGRYLNYGQLQILDETPQKSFYDINHGWDFNFWPGTTARVIPFHALRQKFENVEALTSEYFAGATTLDGNGVWAMKLQEELPVLNDPLRIGPPLYFLGKKEYEKRCRESLYDTGFKARKSMFFFDDRIIALGSGIQSSDDAPVATTLFQNKLEKPQNIKKKFKAGKAVWFMSVAGHGYYVAPGNAEVVLERVRMVKPYLSHWQVRFPDLHNRIETNTGDMELAYIKHGPHQKNGGYEYCIFLKTNAGKLEKQVRKLPYQVLRRDNGAHIVRNLADGAVGYAMFESGNGVDLLKHVDSPCLVMVKPKADGRLLVSVFNPRYDDPDGRPLQKNVPTKLTFNGAWKLAKENKQVKSGGSSEFTVTNCDMMPTEFELVRK